MATPYVFNVTVTFPEPVIHTVTVEKIGPRGTDGVGATGPEIVAAINAELGTEDWQTGGDPAAPLYLQAPDGDYWQLAVTNAGAITRTNIGPTLPA